MQPWLRAKIFGVQFIPDGLIFNLGHQRTAFGYILAIIFSRFAIFAGWTGNCRMHGAGRPVLREKRAAGIHGSGREDRPRCMKHYIQLHLLVLILAATALLGEVISIPSAGVVVWRTLFASVAAALWVKLVWRKALWPGRGTAGALLGVGVVVGLHWMLFFQSLKVSNISICLAGLATIPLFTAFTEPFFERRRIRMFEILVGLVIMAGILVVAGSIDLSNRAGLAYALASAALAAVFPVMNRKLVLSGGDPLTMVAWEMAGALAVSLATVLTFGGTASLLAWHGHDWLWLLVLALVCTVFAHGFQIRLLKYLGAYTVNLAISFEPLYGILAAAWAFGEYKQLTPMFYLGLSAILLANVLHPVAVKISRASNKM